jgi:hypothetical protein
MTLHSSFSRMGNSKSIDDNCTLLNSGKKKITYAARALGSYSHVVKLHLWAMMSSDVYGHLIPEIRTHLCGQVR